MKENPFMRRALDEARAAAERGEVPVGACLTYEGEVIASDGNRVEERKDARAHAEMLVLAAGMEKLGLKYLTECDIYVTLEPCAMCAGAISLARVRRLYYGAHDPKMGNINFFYSTACLHRPEIYSGLGERESAQFLRDFFQHKR